jgi:hypothetical protein
MTYCRLNESFHSAFRATFYEVLEVLQKCGMSRLAQLNAERSRHRYGAIGKRPIETILSYLESVRQEG